jgi:hypothetical protein
MAAGSVAHDAGGWENGDRRCPEPRYAADPSRHLNEQRHEPQEFCPRERASLRTAEDLRDRQVERVMLVQLLRGHLDGNPRVGPRGQLRQHLLPQAPDHAGGETGP